ncbi:MAG: thioredoxin family protein [Acidimicrobiia bacterium]
MARTPSTMLPLGTPAPGFELPDPEGKPVSISDFGAAPVLVVVFLSNHCPFVQHVAAGLGEVARDIQANGGAVVGIMANDIANYPDDRPEAMAKMAERHGWTFPYLHDETQEVAKAYRAACTPDFYVFDGQRQLVYRGQMDGARPGNDVLVTGEDLWAAVEAVLAGRPVDEDQRPSMGCNIKWKAGNEPDYF